MKDKKAIIEQDKEKPIEKLVIADHILEIGRAMKRLVESGLNRHAILVLVHENCKAAGSRFQRKKPSMDTVRVVFNSLADLERQYCKK